MSQSTANLEAMATVKASQFQVPPRRDIAPAAGHSTAKIMRREALRSVGEKDLAALAPERERQTEMLAHLALWRAA